MRLDGHTILITGGTSGIGLVLAERFLVHDNKLIIVGRDSTHGRTLNKGASSFR